jgi:hypothetical protein
MSEQKINLIVKLVLFIVLVLLFIYIRHAADITEENLTFSPYR